MSQMATMKSEKPIILLNKIDDSEVPKNLLRNVPKAVHDITKGKQRIIEKKTKSIFATKPEPKMVPKLPNNTIS